MEAKRDNPLYKYKPLTFYSHGPTVPNIQEISQKYFSSIIAHFLGYLYLYFFQTYHRYAPKLGINASQLSSGFPPHVPVQRLLQDAFADLFYSVRNYPT